METEHVTSPACICLSTTELKHGQIPPQETGCSTCNLRSAKSHIDDHSGNGTVCEYIEGDMFPALAASICIMGPE
ncbi:Hypothetical predicted protein, partial [Pelobates cultripes]